MKYAMNILITLLITFYTPAILFHPSYKVAIFRASILVNQSHYFSEFSIPSIFTISDLMICSRPSPILNIYPPYPLIHIPHCN